MLTLYIQYGGVTQYSLMHTCIRSTRPLILVVEMETAVFHNATVSGVHISVYTLLPFRRHLGGVTS